ncbi:hypothetical protein GWK47_018924 [Chionoecetes opilio]|uniref:Endonuclease/exonuclease/phosphatase domain-containing protein n=1 Tax=Chionoecetes opilio TaxID=41210 RepID=A0A8J4XQA3_CHIOP|nr:hypothetical protein GWK47_018924 [Chionoecetes opilio]
MSCPNYLPSSWKPSTSTNRRGRLEVVAARIATEQGWLSVAVCYNADGATYQELEYYFSLLPPPVVVMGDFNAHHRCWEPDLPRHLTNTSGRALFQVILDSPRLSLLSPPGLPTRYHPHTGAGTVLDLFLGDPAFSAVTVTTWSYMGSDHLPLLASFPAVTARPHPGCLPRWRFTPSGWHLFEEALQDPPNISSLPLDEAAVSFSTFLEDAGTAAFRRSTRRAPRRPGKSGGARNAPRQLRPVGGRGNQWRRVPDLVRPFTTEELDQAFSTLKPWKTAGQDNIPYEFLLHLTPPLKAVTLFLFNTSWLQGIYPTCWKSSTLLPIPKPAGIVAATLFRELDLSFYHHHLKIYTDGSHSPTLPSTGAAIYDPALTSVRHGGCLLRLTF